ncbi:MAG: hypothetical protein WBF33_22225 [Candidatus Nitrosopolaris sp.]
MLQIILDRTETRGAWMKIHEYQLAKSVMLNVTKLNNKQRKLFLQLFENLKDNEFSSILQQLNKRRVRLE